MIDEINSEAKTIIIEVEVDYWEPTETFQGPLVLRNAVGNIDADGREIEVSNVIPAGDIYLSDNSAHWTAILSPLNFYRALREYQDNADATLAAREGESDE